MLYLVAYDVSNDQVRLRMSHILLRFGERVQESVYECRISRAQLAQLTAEANLRVYQVCQTCQRRSIALGAVTRARTEQPAFVF
jgi:CRISPR-associated protein Cas2